MKPAAFAMPVLSAVALAGCAMGEASRENATMGARPMAMAMMSDEQMMDMCRVHMSQMTPEMMQQHHQMMDRNTKPKTSS